jgi:hypothetical protein
MCRISTFTLILTKLIDFMLVSGSSSSRWLRIYHFTRQHLTDEHKTNIVVVGGLQSILIDPYHWTCMINIVNTLLSYYKVEAMVNNTDTKCKLYITHTVLYSAAVPWRERKIVFYLIWCVINTIIKIIIKIIIVNVISTCPLIL